ncbi:MAG: c-type cytochrome [Pirellulaceae bacterium]|nr:c-type cytochrome [Pirellulaceae bacterium]
MTIRYRALLLPPLVAFCCVSFAAGQGNAQEDIQNATESFPTLEYQRWSGDINVPDPVAISVDDDGRVFVTQTQRRKLQDLDIRANPDWVPSDVGLTSVQAKREFYRTQLAIGGDDEVQSRHVQDINQDGHHDWRDLTVISEKIFRLVDSDQNGTADEITTFAEDFRTEVTGIAAGVLAYDGDVWATIAPDVWKLRDHDDDGVADSREVMATGFGLHIAYAGHDMHGLTVGPDGKIYWSIGDKGINVTNNEGKQFYYPNQGGVMRCNPDGSDFEVFAHGLRNVQEFAFDQYGNLFGVDNDADQPDERERFVAIVDAMDAGWRCHYQYRGDRYNAWTDERLWDLPEQNHPAYIIPPIAHYMDGPAGFAFNPGTALGPQYYGFFFVTNAPAGHQYAFRAQPDGDSFKMADAHQIGTGNALVGLAFGPDGGLYGADWDGGYPLDQKGAVIRIDVPKSERLPIRDEVRQLLGQGFDDRAPDELVTLMQHQDMRIRMGAQFALVRQNQSDRLQAALDPAATGQLGRLHCVWGLGQLARAGDDAAEAAIAGAMTDPDAMVRAQAAKTYGEIPGGDGVALIGLLADQDLHVRVNAGLALARRPAVEAVEPLLLQAQRLRPHQHYLRHSIARALSTSATSGVLGDQIRHESELRRMVSLLALRHQASPVVAVFLGDSSAWVATEAARAIHDDQSIAGGMKLLAASLERSADHPEAFVRRAINANLRLGTVDSLRRLIQFASSRSHPTAMRTEACEAIGDWLEPPVLDRVEGIRRDLDVTNRTVDRGSLGASLAALVSSSDTPLQVAAVVAARKLRIQLPADALSALLDSADISIDLKVQALNSIAQSDTDAIRDRLARTVSSDSVALSVRAIELIVQKHPGEAFGVLENRLSHPADVAIHQACLVGLRTLKSDRANSLLNQWVARLATDELNPALELEIAETVQGDDVFASTAHQEAIETLRDQLAIKMKLGDGPANAKFAFSLHGGDSVVGGRLFQTHLQAQCSRCHRIGKQGSDIGPELTKIGKQRDPEYLLRSIVNPSADIEPKYFTQALLMDSGKVIRGVIKSENDDETIVIDSSGKELLLVTDEIEDVSEQKISLMPDMTEVLTPREVRDLVAYLRTLR